MQLCYVCIVEGYTQFFNLNRFIAQANNPVVFSKPKI